MKKWMQDILMVLHKIFNSLEDSKPSDGRKLAPLEDRKLWTKQEVIDKLGMSESTYKRNVRSGLLKPMRLNGTDVYFEEDLLKAMEESRNKGRC
ncbi:helix-turn-helix transcriptional regulator [Sphingobacterium sp. LRF_L2]|uniref:helix-turn-helix transcriptional regulator n=1 Tax=Sphingobacterium sp. LRF_L2 TaxID=3369421 RepID=UPI003F6080C3